MGINHLKRTLVSGAILLLPLLSSGKDAYSLILSGEIEEARELLSKTSTASQRDGNHLFYLALIEPNAAKSFDLMKASLNAGVSSVYLEEINLRLVQYYFLTNQTDRAGNIISEYSASFEQGKFAPQIIRYSVLLDERAGRHESAIRQADRLLVQYSSEDFSQWGSVDKARIMMSFDKKIAARDILTKLSREKSGAGVPAALFVLTVDAAERNRTDDAVFYFNLLQEAYPSAVGLDALLDRMAGLGSQNNQRENSADKRSRTFYSVQVGVFASAENAKQLADQFDGYNQKVDITTKKISDRTYYVVFIGRFDSYESAQEFEKTIEAEHNDVYQVVAR
jgi:hypothetical protein